MSARKPGCLLATAITAALKKGSAPISGSGACIASGVRTVAYTGVALALLQSNTSSAVTLGELQLKSAVGEPFRATTTATIRQGEILQPGCITTSPYKLGTLRLRDPLLIRTPTTSIPGEYTIELATTQTLKEPMYEVQLSVDCAGAASLMRSYIVMLDAPAVAQPQVTEEPKANRAASTAGKPAANANVPRLTEKVAVNLSSAAQAGKPARRPGDKSINPGERYRVAKGDTLFGIAARVNQRPAGTTWAVVELLHRLNPDAFIDNRRELIKLGATLTIPAVEVIANVKNGIMIDDAGTPSTPGPERKISARPALVRNEQAEAEQEIKLLKENDSETSQATTARDTASSAGELKQTDSVETALQSGVADNASSKAAATVTQTTPVAAVAGKLAPADRTVEAPRATMPGERSPADTQPATQRNSDAVRVSYPAANDSVSPLLAGLIGMVIGALFATLVIFGRRVLERFARPDWADHTAALATTQLDAAGLDATEFETTDAFEPLDSSADATAANLTDAESIAAHIGETADQPGPENGTLVMRSFGTDPAPEPDHGTIEVEFSELDSVDKQTLGFDMSETQGDETAQQPQLGETPRLNLEGLGNNFDLQSELQEMLQEFSDAESALLQKPGQPEIDESTSELQTEDATDSDLGITGEVTHPDLAAGTGLDTMKDLQSLADATDEQNASTDELDDEPFSVGLDLDLGLLDDEGQTNEVDVSLEPEMDQETEQSEKK